MKIITEVRILAPVEVVWQAFNDPENILQWDRSGDWRTIKASNDLRIGGILKLRIESRDGTSEFDFAATYTRIELNRLIEWQQIDDGRLIRVKFTENGIATVVRQTFDADPAIPEGEERADWQGVLESFARHVAKKRAA
jgi:uncharacterized protein YndB with AHSA1/START domain